ncbi:hypothetical protein V6N11_027354 [Hibiscus sabdariffa]|uniref:Uncharacterized protein n=1 Tax=Hibiscus sabdariffa TaxID=183260 RepID=A0ABR2PGP2_9ROSI
MLSQENVIGKLPTSRVYEEPGGQPPDETHVLPLQPLLERPPSPSPLEGENGSKRVRNTTDGIGQFDTIAMETKINSNITRDVGEEASQLYLRTELEDDLWITDPTGLQVIAVNFFRSLFTSANIATDGYVMRGRFPFVEASVLAHLGDFVTETEDGRDWNMIFGGTYWFLWLYVNALIYSTEGVESWSVLSKVRNWYDSVAAHMQCASAGQLRSDTVRPAVRWQTPLEGWVKLNTDGAGNLGEGPRHVAGFYG